MTTVSYRESAWPGATAKRFARERASRQSVPDSGIRTPQSSRQHSQRKPAAIWPPAIHCSLRSLRSRHQSSLCATRSSREFGGWEGSAKTGQAYRRQARRSTPRRGHASGIHRRAVTGSPRRPSPVMRLRRRVAGTITVVMAYSKKKGDASRKRARDSEVRAQNRARREAAREKRRSARKERRAAIKDRDSPVLRYIRGARRSRDRW